MRIALSLCPALLLGLALPLLALAETPGADPVVPATAAISQASNDPAVRVSADDAGDSEAGGITDIEAMLVTGQYSGPGLWKVSKGDHALWILGTVAPVPKKMDWYSPQAEAVLARAQEIIGSPGMSATVGFGGMFKIAFSMPTILRARKNPDGKSLQDVLPPDLYARWLALKPVYLGNDKSVEELRPIFAAGTLYQAAIHRSGLVSGSGVDDRIDELARKHKIKWTSTMIRTQIKEPRKLAKSFARAEIDDVQCFRNVLDRLEMDVAHAAERANAWAIGDIATLTQLFQRGDVMPCFEAMAKTEAAQSIGIEDGIERSQMLWLQSVETALAANHTSFATLSVADLLETDGLLARLQARGYDVAVPE